MATRAVDLARTTATREELAFGLANLSGFESFSVIESVKSDAAANHASEGIVLARETGCPIPALFPLMSLALTLRETDPQRALSAADECIRIDRSQRRTWSTVCRTVRAQMRLEHGDAVGGFRDVRDTLAYMARDGDRAMLSAGILLLADFIADTSPSLSLELAALYESDAIAAWGDFRYRPAVAALAEARPEELQAARAAVAGMTYDDAIAFVLNSVDQLIAQCAAHSDEP